jgi:hypothetical protein
MRFVVTAHPAHAHTPAATHKHARVRALRLHQGGLRQQQVLAVHGRLVGPHLHRTPTQPHVGHALIDAAAGAGGRAWPQAPRSPVCRWTSQSRPPQLRAPTPTHVATRSTCPPRPAPPRPPRTLSRKHGVEQPAVVARHDDGGRVGLPRGGPRRRVADARGEHVRGCSRRGGRAGHQQSRHGRICAATRDTRPCARKIPGSAAISRARGPAGRRAAPTHSLTLPRRGGHRSVTRCECWLAGAATSRRRGGGTRRWAENG